MAATHKKPSNRKPAVLRETQSRSLKTAHRKSNSHLSLKQWLRTQPGRESQGADWLHNKRANTSNPELCVGKTRRKKGNDSKKKDAATPTKKK